MQEVIFVAVEFLIIGVAGGFVKYVIGRLDTIQEDSRKAFDEQIQKTAEELRQLQANSTELMKYLHENFVAKEDYMFAQGKFGDTLNSIFTKLDELTKQLNQIIGSHNHSE